MKKITGFLVIALVLFLGGCSFFTTTTTTVTSTENPNTEPIEVWTVEDLQGITYSDDVELMADIDLEGVVWVPLCSHEEPYNGTFNGNGHVISNMTISVKNSDFNGLFASITGDVQDLTIQDFSITYTTTFLTYAGGLAGELSGDVTNVTLIGEITIVNAMSSSYVGLLAGLIQAPVTSTMTAAEFIPNHISGNTISGTLDVQSEYFAYVGGLAGKSYNSEITQNFVSAQMNVTCEIYRAYVGGLVGHHYGGVLIGYEEAVDTTDIIVANNTVVSDITVTSNGTQASIGGLIGYAQFGVLLNNFTAPTIHLNGIFLTAGGFLGEGWYGRLENSVTVGSIDVTLEDNQDLSLSTAVGFANTEFTEERLYHYLTCNTEIDNTIPEDVTLITLSEESFYSTTLNWDDTLFDFTQLISYLPE